MRWSLSLTKLLKSLKKKTPSIAIAGLRQYHGSKAVSYHERDQKELHVSRVVSG